MMDKLSRKNQISGDIPSRELLTISLPVLLHFS